MNDLETGDVRRRNYCPDPPNVNGFDVFFAAVPTTPKAFAKAVGPCAGGMYDMREERKMEPRKPKLPAEAVQNTTLDQFEQLVHPYISNVRARSYGNAIKFWIGL